MGHKPTLKKNPMVSLTHRASRTVTRLQEIVTLHYVRSQRRERYLWSGVTRTGFLEGMALDLAKEEG